MELSELKEMWQQNDKKLSENTRINKEILKQMLISKPEKRILWEKVKTGVNLILPIALILLILVPNIQYRSSIDFYIGILLFGTVSSLIYYWTVRYYMLVHDINFASSVTLIKKNIKKLEKYKIKLKKLSYVLMPFGITGIFLMGKIPLLSTKSILPVTLIVLVMIVSIYYTFKYPIVEQFRKLDSEIQALEELETE